VFDRNRGNIAAAQAELQGREARAPPPDWKPKQAPIPHGP
jgi:hypothetical protein